MTSPIALAPSLEVEHRIWQRARGRRMAVAILAAAAALQALGHLNGDDAWFITFAEKYVSGATPYVDVSDPNPPAAFLAYVPAVLLAHMLGLAPEPVVTALTFAAALLSIGLCGHILKRAGLLPERDLEISLAAACFVLLLVPAFCFAEREHLAVIALLPVLAVTAARAGDAKVSLVLAVLAGVGAGLALAFKPHYALPLGLAVLVAGLRRHAWRVVVAPEIVATGAVVVAYLLAILCFFPAYVAQMLPLAADVYAQAHARPIDVLAVPPFLATVALLAALLVAGRGRVRDPRALVLAAASLGFVASYVIQAKGWMNHAYPGLALALLAATFFLLGEAEARDTARRRRFALFMFVPLLCAAPVLFGALVDLRNEEEYPGLGAAVARLAPAHPRMMALAEELDIGHPLVRRLGGTWVGTHNCLWATYAATYLLAEGVGEPRRSRLLQRKRDDEETFMADLRRHWPDVLLTESPELEAWARHEPALTGLFNAYHLAGKVDAISIWLHDSP